MRKLLIGMLALMLTSCGDTAWDGKIDWDGDFNLNSQNKAAAVGADGIYHIDDTTLYLDGEAVYSLPEGSRFDAVTASGGDVYALYDGGTVLKMDGQGGSILYESGERHSDLVMWQGNLFLTGCKPMVCIGPSGLEMWRNPEIGGFDYLTDDAAYIHIDNAIYRFDEFDADTALTDGEAAYVLGDADPQAKYCSIQHVAVDDEGNIYYAVSHYDHVGLVEGTEPAHKGEVFLDRDLTVAMLDAKTYERTELFTIERHTPTDGFEYADALYLGTNGKVYRWDGELTVAAECPQAEYMNPDSAYSNSEFLLTRSGVAVEYHGPFASKDLYTYP